ncbi:excinuclease ABC subunit A [Anopheles sinensis]|uniref:Excinuclease ABC subunit A n=1 Tax=Anopheles sinensis TaxID=74873 RepID=A0A084VA64_ANOSI|nr:excinuclease ABC subunit A [Anopheles sinensis]
MFSVQHVCAHHRRCFPIPCSSMLAAEVRRRKRTKSYYLRDAPGTGTASEFLSDHRPAGLIEHPIDTCTAQEKPA